MKRIFPMLILTLISTAASAEMVKIPWKGDYAHNYDVVYTPDNKHRSGLSKNLLNGAPDEGGKVQKDGVLSAEIIKPKGSTGQVPFIILMHGCTGLSKAVAIWAKEKAKVFLDNGIGVVILDSFKPRNVERTCGEANYHWGWRRAEDAYSALDYLIENKLAVPSEVYVMGRSNGGTAVMMISHSHYSSNHRNTFAAVFAVSPGCAGLTRVKFSTRLIIFTGDKDNANDPKVCQEIVSDKVQLVLFKGVHHGYEDRGPAYVMSNGWRMEYNANADKETINRSLAVMKSKEAFRARGGGTLMDVRLGLNARLAPGSLSGPGQTLLRLVSAEEVRPCAKPAKNSTPRLSTTRPFDARAAVSLPPDAVQRLPSRVDPTGVERHVSAAYSDLRIRPLPPHFLQRPG
ncbi:dienelactone hydrolase family protein [Bradyrhizobium sp. AZCC 1699]|uniref:dienelactone hydrolase family protein n=1 Tax=Bradyrhizobium sp. AZCC 1699 TaxID=3117024 RepID=UPI002FF3A698